MLSRNERRYPIFGFIVLLTSMGCSSSPESREATFLKKAEALRAKKDYPRALLELQNAAKSVPRDAEPYYQSGLIQLELGDYVSAFRAFQNAVQLNPKHLGAQLKAAELMAASTDKEFLNEAASRLQALLLDSPASPEVMKALATTEWMLGKPEEAAKRLDEALRRFPTHLQSSVALARIKMAQRDNLGAEEVLKKAVASAPQSTAAGLALGEFYVLLQQPQKAEPVFKSVLQLDPKNGPALFGLGTAQSLGNRMNDADETFKRLATLPEKAYKPVHAVFLYQTGKRDAAVAELEGLAKAAPDDREARTRLVVAYMGTGKVSQAEDLLSAALKRNRKDTDALLQRSALELDAGKIHDAESSLKAVLAYKPDSAEAHFAMSRVHKAMGRPNSERDELGQAVKLKPELLSARLALAEALLGSKQAQSALDFLDHAPLAQKTKVPWILQRNWALYALGNFSEMKTGLTEVFKGGRPADAVFQQAAVKFAERDYAGARVAAEEVVSGNAENLPALRLLMKAYAAQNQTPKAIERLRELAASRPKSAPLLHLLGQWYLREKNRVEARKAFDAAIAADPKFSAADLAIADMDIQARATEAGRQRLLKVIAAEPTNVTAMLLEATVEEQANDPSAAISRYREVLKIDESNLYAMNNLAVHLTTGKSDEALALAQRALQTAPDNAGVQDTLGWIYYKKGLYRNAVQYLKLAVQKSATPIRQYHLGMSYLKVGQKSIGEKTIREALKTDPTVATELSQ